MRKHWVAMLSMIGLAGSVVRVQSQVLKGSTNPNKPVTNENLKSTKGSKAVQKTGNSSKLNLNQQTLRQQNQGGVNADKQKGRTISAACPDANNQLTKGRANNQAITKGNQTVTKGNQAVTKGNQQITKGSGNQAITKGNQQITKGNQAITKGNQQITKGNAAQTTVPR
jgi:hypothetical protein